jgi:hypothetical protein
MSKSAIYTTIIDNKLTDNIIIQENTSNILILNFSDKNTIPLIDKPTYVAIIRNGILLFDGIFDLLNIDRKSILPTTITVKVNKYNVRFWLGNQGKYVGFGGVDFKLIE